MKQFNWTKWSAIAEIISSVAIVMTLVYLAVQTQQNTAAILASTNDTIISTDIALNNSVIADPEISLIMTRPDLTDQEKAKLSAWIVSLVRTREHQWLQYKNGVLDQEAWETYLSGLSVNLSYTRTRYMWDVLYSTQMFNTEFSEVVNDYLISAPLFDEHVIHTLIPE